MTKIYVPADSPDDGQRLLADPVKHWRTGYSAKELAYAWMEYPNEFPRKVMSVFESSGFEMFRTIEMLLAIPEYETPLPYGSGVSRSDIFVLAKSAGNLVSITVEGKVSEPFDKIVSGWKAPRLQEKVNDYNTSVIVLDLTFRMSITFAINSSTEPRRP